jgi:hypothetical protein
VIAYPCPYQDNGKWSPPPEGGIRAILVWDGEISLVTGRLGAQFAAQLPEDLRAAEIVDAGLVRSILHSLSMVSDQGSLRDRFERLPGLADRGKWLLIECAPCGHVVKVPLDE